MYLILIVYIVLVDIHILIYLFISLYEETCFYQISRILFKFLDYIIINIIKYWFENDLTFIKDVIQSLAYYKNNSPRIALTVSAQTCFVRNLCSTIRDNSKQ